MGGFFLYFKTFDTIQTTRPNLFTRGHSKGAKGSGDLEDFGWYGSIIEVAKMGLLGGLKEVERANMWDWINVLSHNKAVNDARIAANK